MSENTQLNPQPEASPEDVVVEPESKEPANLATAEAAPGEESTIGTGTSMALGCIAGTGLLIVFALLFLFLSSFF